MNEAVQSLIRKLLRGANLSLINSKLYLPDTENSLLHLRMATQKMRAAESLIVAVAKK